MTNPVIMESQTDRLEGAFHTIQSTRPGCPKSGIEHFQGSGCLQLTVYS